MQKGYGVIFSRASVKDLRKILKSDQEHILQKIQEKLSTDPYQWSIKLEGKQDAGQRRIRIGMYPLLLRQNSPKLSGICRSFSSKCNSLLEIKLGRAIFSNCETYKICRIS